MVCSNFSTLCSVCHSNYPDGPSPPMFCYVMTTDPIYEDELNASNGDTMNGLTILGVTVDLDPTSLTLLGFGLIAFNFFVLANL